MPLITIFLYGRGSRSRSPCPSGGLVSLAERPSGNTWVQVPTVNPAGSGDVQFYAVSASSATNAWAVGSY